jgi:hypothetical protein
VDVVCQGSDFAEWIDLLGHCPLVGECDVLPEQLAELFFEINDQRDQIQRIEPRVTTE